MSTTAFDVLYLIARPAAGKSEIIDYLKRLPVEERLVRFHIGPFHELDDFPLIWDWFEEDRILTSLGKPRLHTDANEDFIAPYLWDVLIGRLALAYSRFLRDNAMFHEQGGTVIVEFARGSEHGGFRRAFKHLPAAMLERGAILYVDVPWEESLRKNRARFNPDRPDSILEHGLSDEKLEQLYRESDWLSFCGDDPDYINIQGVQVPYVVFPNADDVTTGRGPALAQRLEAVLGRLWSTYSRQARAQGGFHNDS